MEDHLGNDELISLIEQSWPAIKSTLNLLPASSHLPIKQRLQLALSELSKRHVKDPGEELTRAVVQVFSNKWRKDVSKIVGRVAKVHFWDLASKNERSITLPGSTPSELRSRIDAHWNEILQRLHIPPSNKEVSFAEKILYALHRLKDQYVQDAEHQLVTVVCEVIAEGCRKEVTQIVKEVEHRVHVPTRPTKSPSQISEEQCLSPVIESAQKYGTSNQVISKPTTPRFCWPCTSYRCCWSTAIFLLLLLVLGALVAMAALTSIKKSQSQEHWVQEGDTVLLLQISSFWYKQIIVTETLEEGDSDHSIDAWVLPCANLKERSKFITFRSRSLYLYYETFLLGEQPGETPIYLLSGSQITYSFLISTNLTLSTKPEFFIFDSIKAFQSFIHGKMEGVKSAVYRQQLAVGTPQNPALTEVSYTVKHNGYYFMTGYSEPGISYQFNATEHVQYLNTSDYRKYPTCQFSTGQTCSFETGSSFLGSDEEYCLIVHINQPYSEDPPSTHVKVETVKRNSVLLLPGAVAIASVMILVLVGFVFILATFYGRRKAYGYTRIQ